MDPFAELTKTNNGWFTRQEGAAGDDSFLGVVALEDGSVVAAGYVNGTWTGEPSIGETDFAAVKLDSDGTLLWRWRVSRWSTIPWFHQSNLTRIMSAAKQQ